MDIERRTLLGLAAGAGMALGAPRASAQTTADAGRAGPPDPTEIIGLWPDGAPGGQGVTVTPIVPERSTDPAFHDRYAQYTTDPVLTVFRPRRPNGSAMLLIPGGGYRWAVLDKEGYDVARVFAASGTTCFVLRYRLPADGWAAGADAPLQDAQRAIRLIRSRAADYGVDPNRIGVLGASAGGHLGGSGQCAGGCDLCGDRRSRCCFVPPGCDRAGVSGGDHGGPLCSRRIANPTAGRDAVA